MTYVKPDSPESEAVFAEIRGVLDSLPYTAPECRAAKVGKMKVTHRVTRVPREGRNLADVGWATNDVDYVWLPESDAGKAGDQ
jgi:hypothetical protein